MNEADVNEATVAELVQQPGLFDLGADGREAAGILAQDAALLFGARTARRPHTGERVGRQEARALLLGAMKLRGSSDREIARVIGCDRRTIPRVMERLEESGVVPPLRARLAGKVGRLAESSADALADLVTAGTWNRDTTSALKGLSLTMGVATDKSLLLMGQATSISANVPAGQVTLPADLNAWVRAGFPPTDCQPPESGPIPQQVPGCPRLESGLESGETALAPGGPSFEGGGGGVARAAAAADPEGSGPREISDTQEGKEP